MNRREIVERLRQQGWTVTERSERSFHLPPEIAARHPNVPKALTDFLGGLVSGVNAAETAWFLCEDDYAGTSRSAYRWDEWEQLTLQAGVDDPKFTAKVKAFWDAHLPFVLSVGDGYEYYAIRTISDGFGKVVKGREPEFEDFSLVAESIEEFLDSFLRD